MATGYDDRGTERLLCSAPPGPGAGDDAAPFKPNIFHGAIPWYTGNDADPIGTSDCVVQAWVLRRPDIYSAAGNDVEHIIGYCDYDAPLTPRLWLEFPADPTTVRARFQSSLGIDSTAPVSLPHGWSYLVAAIDRNNWLSIYLNGDHMARVAPSDAGAPESITDSHFYPLTVNTDTLTADTTCNLSVGPVAANWGSQSASWAGADYSMISDTYKDKTLFAEDDLFSHCIFWDREWTIQPRTGWDLANIDPRILHADRNGRSGAPTGTVTEAHGTLVKVYWQAALFAGNSWSQSLIFPVSASYSASSLAPLAFGYDSFWDK